MNRRTLAKIAYIQGFKLGRNAEELHRVSERMASEEFDKWWQQNHE